MALRFQLHYAILMQDGAELSASADQRDLAAVEAADVTGPISRLRYTAWSALRRAGGTRLDWPEFNAVCVEVVGIDGGDEDEGEGEQDGLDPGRTGPGGDST